MDNLRSHLPAIRGGVRFRPFQESDLPEWYAMEADEELKRYILPSRPVIPYEEWANRARDGLNPAGDSSFVLEDVLSGAFAGRATVHHYLGTCHHEHRELQVVVAKPFLGKRIGKVASLSLCEYAFASLGATLIFGVVHPEHPRSIQLLIELNFSEIDSNRNPDGAIESRVFELSPEAFHRVLARA